MQHEHVSTVYMVRHSIISSKQLELWLIRLWHLVSPPAISRTQAGYCVLSIQMGLLFSYPMETLNLPVVCYLLNWMWIRYVSSMDVIFSVLDSNQTTLLIIIKDTWSANALLSVDSNALNQTLPVHTWHCKRMSNVSRIPVIECSIGLLPTATVTLPTDC